MSRSNATTGQHALVSSSGKPSSYYEQASHARTSRYMENQDTIVQSHRSQPAEREARSRLRIPRHHLRTHRHYCIKPNQGLKRSKCCTYSGPQVTMHNNFSNHPPLITVTSLHISVSYTIHYIYTKHALDENEPPVCGICSHMTTHLLVTHILHRLCTTH